LDLKDKKWEKLLINSVKENYISTKKHQL